MISSELKYEELPATWCCFQEVQERKIVVQRELAQVVHCFDAFKHWVGDPDVPESIQVSIREVEKKKQELEEALEKIDKQYQILLKSELV
jgi:hypothetical protein